MNSTAAEMTKSTLDQITKATTTGITTGTGIYDYDLSALVHLIPVHTPFRDLVPRVAGMHGNPYAVWRAIMDTTSSQPDPAVAFNYAANQVVFTEQDFQASYKALAYAGLVTQDAYDLAKGYGDPYAIATFNTMNQALIGEDRKLLTAQSFALKTAGAPTLTKATTGGSIDASSSAVHMYVAAAPRTGSGYFYGSGNGRATASADANFTTGGTATNKLTATVAAVRGAVCWDWFQSADGTTWYYYTTTTTNTVTMTKVITADEAFPTTLPDLTTTWKGTANTKPTVSTSADNGSANANDYDGFLASLSGDYSSTGQWVQPGAGTANPSTWTSLDGASLTLDGGSIAEIQTYLFLKLWNRVKCSPTAIMVNAAQAQSIANLILGSTSATTFLNTDSSGRIDVTAGGRVGHIVNAPAGGVTVPIEVHPSLPPGTIIARTDRVPFPQANISNVIECRTLRDLARFDYAASRVGSTSGGGPRQEFELRTVSAFVSRAPVAMGVLSNVA